MSNPTSRQVWYVQGLLAKFGIVMSLREIRTKLSKTDPKVAIDKILEVQHREAEKINHLPLEQRAWHRPEFTSEDKKEVFGE